jgi:hypothetical protein
VHYQPGFGRRVFVLANRVATPGENRSEEQHAERNDDESTQELFAKCDRVQSEVFWRIGTKVFQFGTLKTMVAARWETVEKKEEKAEAPESYCMEHARGKDYYGR